MSSAWPADAAPAGDRSPADAGFELEPGLRLRGFGPRHAWPPTPALRLRDFGLVAFDMDSTLINIECIDEIAAAAGRKAEVAAITEAAMRGEISDFSASLQRRLALLQGVPVQALETVWTESLRLNPGVEVFVQACRAAGLKTLLVSGGFTFFAERVRQRLQLDFVRANALAVDDGRLTGELLPQAWGSVVDGQEKRRVLQELASLLGLQPEATLAVGDGANDLPMMAAAGLSIAFHAKPRVAAQARISIEQGGMERALVVLRSDN